MVRLREGSAIVPTTCLLVGCPASTLFWLKHSDVAVWTYVSLVKYLCLIDFAPVLLLLY